MIYQHFHIFSKLFLNISFITRLYNVITSSILQNVCMKIRYVCLNLDFRFRLLNVHMSKKFKHCEKKIAPIYWKNHFDQKRTEHICWKKFCTSIIIKTLELLIDSIPNVFGYSWRHTNRMPSTWNLTLLFKGLSIVITAP